MDTDRKPKPLPWTLCMEQQRHAMWLWSIKKKGAA